MIQMTIITLQGNCFGIPTLMTGMNCTILKYIMKMKMKMNCSIVAVSWDSSTTSLGFVGSASRMFV